MNFLDLVLEVLQEHINRGVVLPFTSGDDVIQTKKFDKDFKRLTPQGKAEVFRFIEEYRKSSGSSPAKFEFKFKGTQRVDSDLDARFGPRTITRLNIYAVQIRHSKPAIHVLVAEGRTPSGTRVISFFRVFDSYDDYTRGLDMARAQAGN